MQFSPGKNTFCSKRIDIFMHLDSITADTYMQGQCISLYTYGRASRCTARIASAADICENVSSARTSVLLSEKSVWCRPWTN